MSQTAVKAGPVLTDEQVTKLNEIIDTHKDSPGSLVNVLHETQEYLGYVPYPAQKIIAEGLNVPMSEIYGVVTFYSRFTLSPVGRYKIAVCMGTACYVKRADKILADIEDDLGIKANETTEDGLFSIDACRCIGACGLAPVIMINEDVYGKLDPDDTDGLLKILEKYKS